MGAIILFFIIMLPVYGFLIWSYLEPEESLLWGNRWMYKEEPEFTDEAIRRRKITSLLAIIGITLIFVCLIYRELRFGW